MSRIVFLFILFVTGAMHCQAQEAAVYNINKYNGLSTNHVYTTLVDKQGYLWLASTEGVYKYNGYSLRKYDYKDGLSNTDVWHMYEDKEGKIWLLNVSNQIGYIYNGRYKKLYVNSSNSTPEIYPSNIVEYEDKIIFVNKTSRFPNTHICIIKNDTLFSAYIPGYKKRPYPFFINNMGPVVIEGFNDELFVIKTEEWIKSKDGTKPKDVYKIVSDFNIHLGLQTASFLGQFAGKYLFFGKVKSNSVQFYNYKRNTIDTINLNNQNEQLVYSFCIRDNFYIISNTRILVLDSSLNQIETYSLDQYYSKETIGGNSTYFLSDSFWGTCISTDNDGLYINYSAKRYYTKLDTDLKDYGFVGRMNDSTGFWWNDNTNMLVGIANGIIIKSYHLPGIIKVKKISSAGNKKMLLISQTKTVWLHDNGHVEEIMKGISTIVYKGNNFPVTAGDKTLFDNSLWNLTDYVFTDSNQFFSSLGYDGINKITFSKNEHQIVIDSIYFDRHKNISYNKQFNTLICYSNDKLLFINTVTLKKYIIKFDQLQKLNIYRIEKLFFDDYGNIIIKDYNKLVAFNINSRKATRLFSNYQLEGAIVDLHKNTLTVAGLFGVLQCTVNRAGSLSTVTVYPNTKNIFYDFVTDAQVSSNSVLLRTDKGAYLINTSEKDMVPTDEYKIILDNDSNLFGLHNNDTITVRQTTNAIGIDVIKPTGTGNLNIEYSINGTEYINSGYQLIIPKLKPGSYNTISVIASDDSWESKPVKFIIYILPKWWQTSIAKNIIFILAILSIVGLVYIIIIVTRRIVNKSNERRNQRRELELKSIYSQINPHFIFNSLSTAQYFVKKNKNKEAFEHINQFSDLLRSYIKSSRNKYITIDEEIENLENYLQLQLTRFEEKFDYSIQVDESVDSKTVKIPSLLLQPIIENALNHGIFHSETKGLLNISFTINKDNKNELICVVDDNGIGRKKSRELRSEQIRKADSYGTILIKELVDTFNKYEKIQIEIEYIDKVEPENGTTVIIRINNFSYAR